MDTKDGIVGKHSPFEIPATTVNEDCDEEHGVEIRDGCRRADDSAPGEAHYPIGNIILVFRIQDVNSHQRRAGLTGLRLYAHQPLVSRRLLASFGKCTVKSSCNTKSYP